MPHYRTIFISDVHLGSKTSRADMLLHFLKDHHAQKIVIIGDFLDFWSLNRKSYFPQSHQDVLRKLLKRSKLGTEIIYIPGNHDEQLRDHLPMSFGNIHLVHDSEHVTADGLRLYLVHGDVYDQVMQYARWLAWMGDVSYHFLLQSNKVVNFVRRRFGFGYWSLSAYVKSTVKGAVNFIGDYEATVTRDVVERGYDGVVCGHIHSPSLRMMGGILYANTGDWCESFGALVEHDDGGLELLQGRLEADGFHIDRLGIYPGSLAKAA